MALRTPLYENHVALGGKIVDFAGYELPVQYPAGITLEHEAVRTKVGLFDVSHMGEFILEGPGALEQLNLWLTNAYDTLAVGKIRYSVMCDDSGGAIDDLIVYRLGEERYMIVVNAANREADFCWMTNHLTCECTLEDKSDEIALLALQGPLAGKVLSKIADPELLPEKYYSFTDEVDIHGVPCLVSQTGYTGEFGFEIYVPASAASGIWDLILKAGEEYEILPCGLGARDTLRLEAGMPLYGHELTRDITPVEAGLNFAVKLDKPDFIGKAGIEAKMPITRTRVGLEVEGKGIVREDCPLYVGEQQVGMSTSGTMSPHLRKAIAMGYVDIEHAQEGTVIMAEVRKKQVQCKVVALPFYKREK